jgi:uncharacterized protein (DUF983 family)
MGTDPAPTQGETTLWAARSTPAMRFRRGITGACPRCGGRGINATFFDLQDACPNCSWTFEREEGYWVGAMVVLMAAVLFLFGSFIVIGIVAFWPDVHWNVLLWTGLAMNGLIPVLLFRWSRTTWLGLHAAFVPAELEQDHASRTGA